MSCQRLSDIYAEREPDDPGPPECACGWPLLDCRSRDGWVPDGHDYSGKRAVPKAGDRCPREDDKQDDLGGVTEWQGARLLTGGQPQEGCVGSTPTPSAERPTRDEAERQAFEPKRKRQFAQTQKGLDVRRGLNGKALARSRNRKREMPS